MVGFDNLNAEQVRNINDYIHDKIVSNPKIQGIMTLYPNIVFNKEVGFLSEGGLLGKEGQGCNPNYVNWNVTSRKLTWVPTRWGIYAKQCFADLEATCVRYSMKKGIKTQDLDETDYATIIADYIVKAMEKMVIRIAWFGDKQAETQTNSGELTNGTDKTFFNWLDGLFKQMETQVTANPKQLVTIAENSGATYSQQALTPANAYAYLSKVFFGAPLALRSEGERMLLVTQSVYDAYVQYLQGLNIVPTYTNLVEGIEAITFNGIPVIAMPVWDELIDSYYNTSSAWVKPHRIVYTSKKYLGMALDSMDSLTEVEVFTDKVDENTYFKAKGLMDVKLMNPTQFVVAI